MRRERTTGLMLGGVLAVGGLCLATGLVDASTVTQGTAVTVEAVDNVGATFWTWMVTWGSRVIALGLGYSGLTGLGSNRQGGGGGPLIKLGGGVAAPFVGGVVNNAITAAPAMTQALATQGQHFWQQLASGLSGEAILHEPILWLVLGLTFAGVAWTQSQRQAQGRLV